MNTLKNISLLPFNTFGIDAKANVMLDCLSEADVEEAAKITNKGEAFVLGGGSNVLFTNDIEKAIIRPMIQGIEITGESGTAATVKVGAGVVWDDFVDWCVNNDLQGVENLSGIPGNAGASPVQNIGAYGMEAGNAIAAVDGFFIGSAKKFHLDAADCQFAYRYSIFKGELRNGIIITHVTFRLVKGGTDFRLNYGHVDEAVAKIGQPTLKNIRKAIISIRNAKLPDPKVEGNAGSFFKNPEVDAQTAERLKTKYPNMPNYALPNGKHKIPAGWLIETAGWKGRTLGKAGVHDKQALVLVNKGGAAAADIVALSTAIRNDVEKMFGIGIEPEVNFIG